MLGIANASPDLECVAKGELGVVGPAKNVEEPNYVALYGRDPPISCVLQMKVASALEGD